MIFGSQYTQLIARRVRELNVYSEIHPFNKLPNLNEKWKGIIFSGSPHSVFDKDAPQIDLNKIKGKVPLLAVCYGSQYLANKFSGNVVPSKIREYGRANLTFIDNKDILFDNVPLNSQVWMSHADTIASIPNNFNLIASTKDVRNAAYKIDNELTYGLQFHPEVYHSEHGFLILKNFLLKVCNCIQDWTPIYL